MELYIYDRDLNRLGVVDQFESLIWIRRFWTRGEFKMLVPYTPEHIALFKRYRLIGKKGDAELGEIKYIHLKKDSQGAEKLEVQGKFITSWVAKRIIAAQITDTAPAANIIRRIITENVMSPTDPARKIAGVSLKTGDNVPTGTIEYASEPFENALDAIENIAKGSKIGIRLTSDIKAKNHTFEVYAGRDLTSANTNGNRPCVFSPEFDNVGEQEYVDSVENLKTTALVGGEERELKLIEVAMDKQGYLLNCLDELGGITFNKNNIEVGYIVEVKRWGAVEVVGKGPVNIAYKILTGGAAGLGGTVTYAEITKIVKADKGATEKHPFEVGERYTTQRITYPDPNSFKSTVTMVEYEIVKRSDTTIQLKEVGTDDKPITRRPRKRWNGGWMFSIDDWPGNTFYKK